LEQHIGLGKSAQIVSVEIRWPGTIEPQVFANVGKNQALEITEGGREYKKLERRAVRLGKGGRE
jgi:hypothetical protein